MKGEVPEEFLDRFMDLPEDTHMYLVGIQLPNKQAVQWHSQEMSTDIRKAFSTPEIWDRRVMDDLIQTTKREMSYGGNA